MSDSPALRVHFLGTGAAISDPHRTTVMLAFESPGSVVAVDCGGDLVQRLLAAEIDLDRLDRLVITHEHPDHVSGFPLFMEKIWLSGRRRSLPVHGIDPAIGTARRLLEVFDTSGWKGMPSIDWREVPLEPGAFLHSDDEWEILSSPVDHSKPNVGLRLTHHPSGAVVAYSCDTAPSEAVVELGRGADLLIHEANGDLPGHSSARQAAEIAAEAGVQQLYLVHVPPGIGGDELEKARSTFSETHLSEELGTFSFD